MTDPAARYPDPMAEARGPTFIEAPVAGDSSSPVLNGPAPVRPGKQHSKHQERTGARAVLEWVVIIASALIVALVVKTFLIQAFYIPSGSMQPTLNPGDRVLVNKLSYHLHPIHRGDIVVFRRPPAEAGDPTIKDLIKRVIGLPGDTLEARPDGVYVNGQLLKELYLPPGTLTTTLPSTKVPPGTYFVMGDNRTNSRDSRFIGPIPGNLIVGRSFIRVWPLSKLGFP